MAKLELGMETLLAAVTDGRTENVRYRQNELYSLFTGLKEKSNEIRQAISQTVLSSNTKDSEKEFFLGMDAIRQAYEGLDFDRSLKDEYLVTMGADNSKRRVGLGLVAIRPTEHSRFYSIISPLVSAISAGNCVLVEIGNSHSPIDQLLASTLVALLDRDTFFITTSSLDTHQLSKTDALIDQTKFDASQSSRSIAVIDRSADLDQAAKSIVTARLFSNGRSSYATDLVLVNEFICEAFVKLCFKHAKELVCEKIGAGKKTKLPKSIQEAEAKGQVRVHSKVPGLTVIEISDPNFKPLEEKIDGPYIAIISNSGLVSSVSSLRNEPTFLATYIFSSPKAAKFLSEQTSSYVCYINQIPLNILVGPVSPSEYLHQLHPRYTTEMFSQPRPQVIEPVKELEILKEIKDLKPTGQRPGHAVGFFEQGIFLGLGITAFIILPSLGYGVFRVGKVAWSFAVKTLM